MGWTCLAALSLTGASPDDRPAKWITQGVSLVVSLQEGVGEWPYEGVYRVADQIPIGYRVGGTAICGRALLEAPGYKDDKPRQEAIRKGMIFILTSLDHPLMDPAKAAGYDVRGWGWIYALTFLVRAHELKAPEGDLAKQIPKTIETCIKALEALEVKGRIKGGWSYLNAQGGPPTSFMTAPAVQALLTAKGEGFVIDDPLVKRAIEALERGRSEDGMF